MDWRERAERLARTLAEEGITDQRVLEAMARVPRHLFVPEPLWDEAYRNIPLPIGEGQTISQPYMVAYMTQRLGVSPGDRVLEIGTGSGYQAALLSEMGCEVHSVERIRFLAERARRVLESLGYKVRIRVGDGNEGWPEEAPFSGILVTAGARGVPPRLREQLAPGARMVIPVGSAYLQRLLIIERTPGGFVHEEDIPCNFVPLVGPYSY